MTDEEIKTQVGEFKNSIKKLIIKYIPCKINHAKNIKREINQPMEIQQK